MATSLIASARIGDGNVVAALEGFAFLAAATGDPRQAVVVFSAAEAIQAQTGIAISALDLAQRDRELEAARQQLEKAAFDLAWNRGAAMSLDDAISVLIESQGIQQES